MQSADDRPNTQRLCHVNLAAGFRGGERQTQLLISELAARGWSQRLIARRGGALARRCRNIERLEIREVARNPLSAAAAAAAARGSALVHAHEGHAIYAGWLLKRAAGTPYLLTRRLHYGRNRSLVRELAWRASDSVVAISESIADSITAQYGTLAVHVVHSAHADMLNGHPTAEKVLAGLGGKTVVGHVGELDHSHKGQLTIIEAARAIRASRPDLHFVLVGEGKDGNRLRRAAEGLDNVSFTGFVENVEDYLAVFDVFVYPSLFEGLGSALLDGMAFGLPIVASNVGGIPEVVEEGVNGLLIPPERPDRLVRALTRLMDDDDLRDSMRRENRSRAAQFSVGRMTDAYEAIYRKILAPPGTVTFHQGKEEGQSP